VDINIEARLISVTGKGRKQRLMPISPTTLKTIWQYLKLRSNPSEFLWLTEEGRPLTGDGVEPIEYIYRARPKIASKNIQAYVVHGDCLSPKINDKDVIIIDKDGVIDNGDIVACVLDNQFHLLRVCKVADELWLENNHGKFKFEQCQDAAPVIECIRRLK
jgi:hypothetical protein